MSHSRERSEKTCLNCNAQLHGRFCHVCGQENTDPRESLWSIITHFFNDITHFDGKFFKTAGNLLVRPGFLPQEFVKGRRARYLHPIRLYVFTSAIFFLVFYSFPAAGISASITSDITGEIGNPLDSVIAITQRERPYTSVAHYDSVQRTLTPDKRDNWITRKIMRTNIERNTKYSGRRDMMMQGILDNFIHSFPYLLFVSLPICALLLKVLYIRNKNNLYAGHTMFLVYLYVFTFLVLLLYFLLGNMKSSYSLGWIGYLQTALILYLGIYTIAAMKNFYAQGWGITILKFIVYNILAFNCVLFLFVVFFVITLLKV